MEIEKINTMTTAKESKVMIGIAGTAVINWGDGTVPKTVTFPACAPNSKTIDAHIHTFFGTPLYYRRQRAKHYTSVLFNLQLTALDVSKQSDHTVMF